MNGIMGRIIGIILLNTLLMFISVSHAKPHYEPSNLNASCKHKKFFFDKTLCQNKSLQDSYQQIQEKYQTALLSSNAPQDVLKMTQELWLKFIQKCKTSTCLQQQMDSRIDELTLLTTLNQSLSQHYLRYQQGTLAEPITQLQLQQLDKNQIKIEVIQYKNPNNHENNQYRYLRSYTSPQQLDHILDVESKCTYQIIRYNTFLQLKNEDKICQSFVGQYRLLD